MIGRVAQKSPNGAKFGSPGRQPWVGIGNNAEAPTGRNSKEWKCSRNRLNYGWPRRPGRAAGSRSDKKPTSSAQHSKLALPYARRTEARTFVAVFLFLLVPAGFLRADDKTADLNKRLDDDIARLTDEIKESPKDVDLYSRRGDAHFFRGKFAEAAADYEKTVELKPDLDTSHWRKGIAYFYAQRYKDAAHQFEIYHSFDNVDRENGIWRYLSQVKAIGRDKAREGLLKYEKDDREPFPDVYRMFSGDLSGDDVLKRINSAEISALEKEKRLFYAELYVGLNDYVDGRTESAEKHLEQATKNTWGSKAGGGPGYMWHVARVHHELLVAEREKKSR
jgi:lipoprotein NlpI